MSSAVQDVEAAFTEETNRLIAERFPIGGAAFVIVFAIAWIFEHQTHPERDIVYAVVYSLQTATVIAGLAILRRPAWQTHVRAVCIAALLLIIALVGVYNVAVRSHAEVLTMALLYLTIGSMVAFPLGWQGQLPIALATVVTLVVAVLFGAQTNTPLQMHVLGLGVIGLLTVSGAFYLNHQRFAVFSQAVKLQQANDALAEANQALADANRTKNEFLANVSHELRTPLNIILGYTDLLADGEFGTITEEAREALERIGRTCRTLVFLISDLLDLSRIEAGRLDIRPAHVELQPLFEEMRLFVEPRLVGTDIEFRLQLDGRLAVTADKDRLEQILVNLLSNATKFTERGSISLSAFRDGGGNVCIEVADSGVGISESELPTLFEPFRQGSAGQEIGGVGIGLSLSLRLASVMGGQLTATSKVGEGTIFMLRLPGQE